MNAYDRITRPQTWRDVAYAVAVGLVSGAAVAGIAALIALVAR